MTQTHTHARAHSHTRAHTHECTHTHALTCTHSDTRTHVSCFAFGSHPNAWACTPIQLRTWDASEQLHTLFCSGYTNVLTAIPRGARHLRCTAGTSKHALAVPARAAGIRHVMHALRLSICMPTEQRCSKGLMCGKAPVPFMLNEEPQRLRVDGVQAHLTSGTSMLCTF